MFRRLMLLTAIVAAALALIRLNARRAAQRAADEAAHADWESEGGSSAATGPAAPSA